MGLAMDNAVELAVGISLGISAMLAAECGGAAVARAVEMLWAVMASSAARAVGTTLDIASAVAVPWPVTTRGPCRGKPRLPTAATAEVPWHSTACRGRGHCRGVPL